MGFDVKLLADSLSPDNIRLTTFELTFPRFLLAELNTHRVFSRNSASSRAIPPEKLIEKVINDPFVPLTFNKRVKGMGVGDELDQDGQEQAEACWLECRDDAVRGAKLLAYLDVDKSRVNRLLEPFMWHTAIVTATEWGNFFALRNSSEAQPEFQYLAEWMQNSYEASEGFVDELNYGEWHTPLVTDEETKELPVVTCRMLSASRCARVSYDTQHDEETIEKSIQRYTRLKDSGHLSPLEHVATPIPPKFTGDDPGWFGNFHGWMQLRHTVPNEDDYSKVKSVQVSDA